MIDVDLDVVVNIVDVIDWLDLDPQEDMGSTVDDPVEP